MIANWKLIAIGVLSLLLAITFKMWRHEVEAFAQFSAEVKAEGEKAKERAARIEQEQQQITEEVGNAYAENIDALRAHYDRLYARARSGGMPEVPTAPARLDEVPADALPLAGQCAETTEQLIRLQEWIDRQEWISKE